MSLPLKVGHNVWFISNWDYSSTGVIEDITKEEGKTVYTVKNDDTDYTFIKVVIADVEEDNSADTIIYRPPNRPYYGGCIADLVHDYLLVITPPIIESLYEESEREIRQECNRRGLEIFNEQGLFLVELKNSKRIKVISYE